MIATNYSTLRDNLKEYMDRVCDDYDTLVVTRKGEGRNVVMLSEESYSNMLENMYIRRDKRYYDRLLESKRQLEEGLGEVRELVEPGDE